MNVNKNAVVIPTLNSLSYTNTLLSKFDVQSLSIDNLIILDSMSDDGSRSIWLENKYTTFHEVKRSQFTHGGTRNLGAKIAMDHGAQIIIFMTQDALPLHETWLESLIAPISGGEVVATFARQLPRPEADPMEKFARHFNYPGISQIRRSEDIPRLGVKAFFFSNVCAAVRADVFWEVGGFPEHTILNEDMVLAARLMRHGYATKYVAESEVVHSHSYTVLQQFKRSFDIGAFFADSYQEMQGAAVGGEGLRFVVGQAKYVVSQGRPGLLFRVFFEAAARFLAFQLGKQHRRLPLHLKKKLSMHSYHWDQSKEQV